MARRPHSLPGLAAYRSLRAASKGYLHSVRRAHAHIPLPTSIVPGGRITRYLHAYTAIVANAPLYLPRNPSNGV